MCCADTDQDALEITSPHVNFFVPQSVGIITRGKGSASPAHDSYEVDVAIDQLICPLQFRTLMQDGIMRLVALLKEQVVPKFSDRVRAA